MRLCSELSQAESNPRHCKAEVGLSIWSKVTSRLGVLRVLGWDDDLVRVPEHVPILDLEHLAEAAAGFERTDDPIAHLRAGQRMLDAIHLAGTRCFSSSLQLRTMLTCWTAGRVFCSSVTMMNRRPVRSMS